MKARRLPERAGGPVRACLGCGEKLSKRELLRFGADRTGRLELDPKKNLPGRGVYCCPRSDCLARLAKRKGRISKALRIDKVDSGLVERLVGEFKSDDAACFN
jgi:hypothetical protein